MQTPGGVFCRPEMVKYLPITARLSLFFCIYDWLIVRKLPNNSLYIEINYFRFQNLQSITLKTCNAMKLERRRIITLQGAILQWTSKLKWKNHILWLATVQLHSKADDQVARTHDTLSLSFTLWGSSVRQHMGTRRKHIRRVPGPILFLKHCQCFSSLRIKPSSNSPNTAYTKWSFSRP